MQAELKKIHSILLACFVFSMPFTLGEFKLNSYLIVLLIINFVLLSVFAKNEIKPSFNRLFILFIAIYIMHFMGSFRADNLHEASFELQKKLSVLIFPVILFFSPKLTYVEVRLILLSFVISCLLVTVVCLSVAGWYYIDLQDQSVFFYHNLSAIVGMHATYLSMYLCFSIAILFLFFSDVFITQNLKMRIVYCVSLIILSVMILLLGARMQQLILLAGTVIYFLFRTYKKMGLLRSVAGAVLIGAFIIGLTLLSSSNRERFKEAFNYDIENRYGERQGRFLIWSCAMELIKSAPVIGTGIGDVQDDLQKCYLQHEYISLTYLKDTRFNAHNQFLETAIELGVPGLLMLIISLFLSLRFALKHKKILYLVFIMLFIISCMTESLLERQNGIVFYAFFNSLLFLYGSDKEAEYAREKVPAGR